MPDFLSIKQLRSKWDGNEDKFQAGIGYSANNGGGGAGAVDAHGRIVGAGGAGGGRNAFTSGDVDEDRVNRLNVYLRAAQIFFAFVSLCILIALAIFQDKWIGGVSGLTGLLLFITCATLLSSLALLLVPLIAERTEYRRCHGMARALQEARVGLVCNGAWVILLLIISLTQTISAYTSAGCKNPAKDPHASSSKGDHKVFQAKLGDSCRNKRALAAFLWFDWIAWLLSLLLFLRSWRLARKNGPRIPPFVHPTDDSAFEPVHAGEDEDDLYSRYDGAHDVHAGGDGGVYDEGKPHYQNSYGDGGRGYAGIDDSDPLSGIAAKYGLGARGAGYGYDDHLAHSQQSHSQQYYPRNDGDRATQGHYR